MTIGNLNHLQFNVLSSVMTLRARELVNNMIVMDISNANSNRSGADSADFGHNAKGGNFSASA